MSTTTDTAHLPLTTDEIAFLDGRRAAGAFDVGPDGDAYLIFRGEWVSAAQVDALLAGGSPCSR